MIKGLQNANFTQQISMIEIQEGTELKSSSAFFKSFETHRVLRLMTVFKEMNDTFPEVN